MLIPLLLQIAPLLTSALFAVCLWLVLVGFLWSIGEAFMQGRANLQRLHQIPCCSCTFFTNDHRLKCPVHPNQALTEEAIDCLDYEPAVRRSADYRRGDTNGTVKRKVQP